MLAARLILACACMQIHACCMLPALPCMLSHANPYMQPQRPPLSQAQCSRGNPKLLQHSNIITVRKSFYSPKILQCMYPNITVLKQHYYKSKPQSNNYNSQVLKHTHVSISIKQPVRNAVTKGIHLFTICAIRGRLCFWRIKIGFSRHKVNMMI